jgi:hypothetical protein
MDAHLAKTSWLWLPPCSKRPPHMTWKSVAREFVPPIVMKALRPPPEATNLAAELRTSPATKVAQLQLWHYYRSQIEAGRAPNLCNTGFRCFSQVDEDGLILFLIAALGISQGVFLDIGAADGINSNCANLALNFGWRGTFIDGSEADIARGRAYYERHPDTWLYPPTFIHCMVNRENINQTLIEASVPPEVDLMSIDIDGNDYWIWEAITALSQGCDHRNAR